MYCWGREVGLENEVDMEPHLLLAENCAVSELFSIFQELIHTLQEIQDLDGCQAQGYRESKCRVI